MFRLCETKENEIVKRERVLVTRKETKIVENLQEEYFWFVSSRVAPVKTKTFIYLC